MHTNYTLVTPARNESDYIGKTIKSVISQTILPQKWVIVSDGSTDGTDEIVKRYANEYDFIILVHLDSTGDRNFGAKVNAIHTGYNFIKKLNFNYFGNLDADISFDPNYYEKILSEFEKNPKLGIAGGRIVDVDQEENQKIIGSLNSVGCAVQMFRRQCYEKIGGYLPLKIGGEDAVAETMARMYGWEVKTFSEINVNHHRLMGTAGQNIYKARFFGGVEEYVIGYHPLFLLAKCIYRLQEKPKILGSVFRLIGYFWSWCRRQKREVSDDFINYLRKEQMQRLRSTFWGKSI